MFRIGSHRVRVARFASDRVSRPEKLIPNPEIRLADVPALAESLRLRISESGFRPDVMVYVETGARIPGAYLCGALGIGGVPVVARRTGHALKRLLAPLAVVLPKSLLDWLRRAEESTGIHAKSERRVWFPGEYDFRGKAVLVFDDASDTGGTLKAVKRALVDRGVEPERLRCAVLAATTPAGRAQADFYVSERNSVLPWSSDSRERKTALTMMAETVMPPP